MDTKITKKDCLKETIEHVDITKLNATPLVEAYRGCRSRRATSAAPPISTT